MRVIAGTARGASLSAPRDKGTRPITDRVKETLFGILADRVIDARVLDLYAGSGAIGIEALSRGAVSATFVERGRDAVAAIRANLARTPWMAPPRCARWTSCAGWHRLRRTIATSWRSWIRRTRSVLSSRRSNAWCRC
jgi:16S rRNA G966 N2-methylase RsmD